MAAVAMDEKQTVAMQGCVQWPGDTQPEITAEYGLSGISVHAAAVGGWLQTSSTIPSFA